MNTSSPRPLTSLLLPLVLLGACTVDGRPREPDPTAGLVEVAPAPKAELPTFVGVVTSRVNKVVIAETEAKVLELDMSVGKRVKKGDLLAKLDDTELKARLATARAQAAAAGGDAGSTSAQISAAATKLRNERILFRNGSTSRSSVLAAEAELNALRGRAGGDGGRYKAAANEVATLEAQLGKTQIRSEIDGVVTRIRIKDGGLATKGTPIAHVFDDSDLLIKFKVDREYRDLVKLGDRIAFAIEGEPEPILATINYISDELEPPLNFTIVEADLDDSKLRANQIRVASNGRVSLYDQARKQPRPEQTAAR